MKPRQTLRPSGFARFGALMIAGLWFLSATYAQTARVSGVVRSVDSDPLIGANVVVKGTLTGDLTDESGKFTVNASLTDGVLVISYIGYKTQEVAISGREFIEITLEEAVISTDEMVIVGYGVQRKSDLTGSISSVKQADIARIPTPSIEQALQGKIAGVQVTPISGAPGAGAVIRIRGVGTLNNSSPLYVVDGMLLDDISFLNTNDISSIEVLKDASATAIYGSRGANGVVIITTLKGTTGDTRFNFNAYYGIQEVTRQIELTNAQEYATLANEAARNENRREPFADPTIFGEGTNWQDVIFRQAPMQNVQLSASGNTDKTSFFLSGDVFSQQGIIKESDFQRISLRFNNEYKASKWLTFGHNFSIVYRQNQNAPGVLGNAYRADPTVAPIDSNGVYGDPTNNAPIGNPLAQFEYESNNDNFGYRTVGNMYAEAKFLKNFRLRTSFGLDYGHSWGKSFVPEFFVSTIQQNLNSNLNVYADRFRNWLWENTLTFDKEWADHRLNILGGITAQDFVFENLGGSRINFPETSPTFWYLNAGQIEGQTNFNGASSWSMASYLFRANYSYKERYLVTVSARADGSSRFGRNKRYGFFPSAALGWNLGNESFMENVEFINRLKIRGSWGVIGNDKIGEYASQATVTPNLNAVFGTTETLNNGASLIVLANPDLQWESTAQVNGGVEIGLLDDRFVAELDYYRRVTSEILVDVPIPAYVGAANNPIVNAAQVSNQGIDFKVTWRDAKGDFGYHISLLGSTVKNEVLSLGEGKEEIFGGGLGIGGLLGTRTVVGLPIGAFYGYVVEGVFQNQEELNSFPKRGNEVPGDLRYADMNNDGVITSADRTYLGSPIPNFIFGASLGFDWKGFDFVTDLNGVTGNYIANSKKMARFGTPNYEVSFLDRWTGEGTSDTEPRITDGGGNYEFSTRFLEKGDFLRIRNMTLGYSLPKNVNKLLNLGSLRVFASGTNLVTWTPYSGYTPEIVSNSVIANGIDFGIYPISRTYTFGVTADF